MTNRTTSNRSSSLRKRALRKLSHGHYPEYSALYEHVLSQAPDMTRHRVRSRTWTQLRYQFPDQYLELYALERAGIEDSKLPPGIRSRCWQRASTRLAHSDEAAYQAQMAEFRGQGMTQSKAYDRAVAALRADYGDFFARLLAEEYQRYLATAGESAGDRSRASARSAPNGPASAERSCTPGEHAPARPGSGRKP